MCELSSQVFCDTYSLPLRECLHALTSAESIRKVYIEQHGGAEGGKTLQMPVLVRYAGAAGPRSRALDMMHMRGPLGMRFVLDQMHSRAVMDANGAFVFPDGVQRVFIDVGAHHCTLHWRDRDIVTDELL